MDLIEAQQLQKQAEEVIRQEYNNRKQIQELLENQFMKELEGRYFESSTIGADKDPFQVHKVLTTFWNRNDRKVHTTGYWHSEHYLIKIETWDYETIHNALKRESIKEIDRDRYYMRVIDFLDRVRDLDGVRI